VAIANTADEIKQATPAVLVAVLRKFRFAFTVVSTGSP
jgi:hypothetical protein